MTSEPATAVALVARIQAGEAVAEAELYERYRRGLFRILKQMTRSPDQAEDLLQETFRLAIEKLRDGELRDASRLPQFLNSLARNLAIHDFRREKKRRGDSPIEDQPEPSSPEEGPFQRVDRRQKASLALNVLGELKNSRDREILYRFYIAEHDKDEICGGLGISSLHFNRVLHRARQRYRQLFESVIPERQS